MGRLPARAVSPHRPTPARPADSAVRRARSTPVTIDGVTGPRCLVTLIVIALPCVGHTQAAAVAPSAAHWRLRADVGFGLAAQSGAVADGRTNELAPTMDVIIGVDHRVGQVGRFVLGVSHVFPVYHNLVGSAAPPRQGDTSFDWRFAVMPTAAIELAPVSWWSLGIGVRAGVGFGEARVLVGPLLHEQREAGIWPAAHAFAQTAFSIPTRPSVGFGGRAAAGWSVGPEILLELMLTASY